MKLIKLLILLIVLVLSSCKEDEIQTKKYRDESIRLPNKVIATAYYYYNHYYAGYYLKEGKYVLSLKEGVPESFINEVKESAVVLELVDYSHSELDSLKSLLSKNMNLFNLYALGIDYSENQVNAYIKDGDEVSDKLSVYINDGILNVIETDVGSYRSIE